MPRTGRPPKPTEEKRRLGNPGKRRLPAALVVLPPAIVGEVVSPDDRSVGAVMVRELLATAASAWIADPDRIALLDLLRRGWDRRAELLDWLEENGDTYESHGQSGYRVYRHPKAIELESVEKRLTTWLSLSGLTPTDRSRLGVAEVKAQSHLDALRARRDARASRSHAG